METKLLDFAHADLLLAGEYIRQGKLVVFPNDCQYSLGANALNENALERIYSTTGLLSNVPLTVSVWNKQQFYDIAKKVSDDAEKIIDKLLPANIVLCLPRKTSLSPIMSARSSRIGVTMPYSAQARKFLQYAEVPVVHTSANLVGSNPPKSSGQAYKELGGNVPVIVCGADCEGKEPTIIDLTHDQPVILRVGSTPAEVISEALGKHVSVSDHFEDSIRKYRKNTMQIPMVLSVEANPMRLCAYYDKIKRQGYNPVLFVENPALYGDRNTYPVIIYEDDVVWKLCDSINYLESKYDFIIASFTSRASLAYDILNQLVRRSDKPIR